MKTRRSPLWIMGLLLAPVPNIHGQDKLPLTLVQKIPLPNVRGRIDHMDVDVKGQRLFVAGLENGTLEVVDLKAGKWAHSVPGLKTPQGVAYVPALNKLFVANENDDTLKVFRGDTLVLLDTIRLDLGANRVSYDPHGKKLYIGYGGASAKKDYGELGVIDAEKDQHIGDIKLGVRPAEILVDRSGQTLFVFDSIAGKIQVIDAKTSRVLSIWPVSGQRPGDGAFDEATHRLFIGTRTPPAMIVMDSASGKEIASLPTVEGMDGVYFDATRKRVYVSGGRGFDVGAVFVYQQRDADRYTQIGKIPTRPGAGTSFWSPELNRYYVAAPASGKESAAILVFEPQP
ncbi:MAG TPA: YncE family protein [Bryobacteraceae bacterium]|nr:YncE family protein [Bryobacteraceae bacterium]